MRRTEFVRELTRYCSTTDETGLTDQIMWRNMMEISEQRRETFVLILPLLFQYAQDHASLAKVPPKYVLDAIKAIKMEDEQTWAVIRLMPFLQVERCFELLQTAMALFREALAKNRKIDRKFLDVFADVVFDGADKKKVSKIAHHISENIQDPEYLICFAALSKPLIGYARGLLNMIDLPGFSPPRQQRTAFNVYFRECAEAFNLEGVRFDRSMAFTFLLNGVVGESEAVAEDSSKTLGKLLEAKVLMDEKFAETFLKAFKSVKNPKFYFKSMAKFVRFADKEHSGVIELIHAFVSEKLTGSNHGIKPYCLMVLPEFACHNPAWLNTMAGAIEDEIRWILGDKSLYGIVSPFFVTVAKHPGILRNSFIDKCVCVLYEGLQCDSSHHLAVDLAILLSLGYRETDKGKLSAYLKTVDVAALVKHVTEVIVAAKGNLDEPVACEVFRMLKDLALTSKSYHKAVLALKGMSRLLKFYRIPMDDSLPVAQSIMSGELAILYKCLPYTLQPPEKTFFSYVSAFVSRYPDESGTICKTLITWVKATPFSGIRHILKALRIAASKQAIDTTSATALVEILGSVITALCPADIDLIESIVLTLKEIWSLDQNIPNIDALIDALLPFVQSVPLEEEEVAEDAEEDRMDSLAAIPVIMDAIFFILATATRPVATNKLLLQLLIRLIRRGITDSATTHFSQLLRNPNLSLDADVIEEGMSMLTSLALTVQYPPTVQAELKATMHALLADNRALQRKITEPFVNSRHRMTKFQELML